MSWLSKGASAVAPIVTGGAQNLLTGTWNAITGQPAGFMPGSQNPYGPPNLDFLRNSIDLLGKYKKIDTNTSDKYFQDLLRSINAPSSVNEVQKGIDSQRMKELLTGIDTDTANAVGSLKSDFLDRGLGGPGQISDIEAAGLGNLRGGAEKAKSAARLDFSNQELNRLKEKEQALQGAYGARYGTGLDVAKTNAGIYNDLLKTGAGLNSSQSETYAKLLADLFSGGQTNQRLGYQPSKPGLFENIINNFGPKFGETLGGGGGKGVLSMLG